MARRNMFSIHQHQNHQHLCVDAATWTVNHSSWEHPFQLSGIYRNHPSAKRQGGAQAYAKRTDTETSQLTAIEEMAALTNIAAGPALMIGDFNIALGRLQEDLKADAKEQLGQRQSVHNPIITASSLATGVMRIIDEHDLMVLNGRHGTMSAETTFEAMVRVRGGAVVRTHTTIDYAICRQDMAHTIVSMTVEKNNGAGTLSDHRPIRVAVKCEARQGRQEGQGKEEALQWHAPVDR